MQNSFVSADYTLRESRWKRKQVTRRVFGPKLQEVTGIWRHLRDENLKVVNRTVIPVMNGESELEIGLITKVMLIIHPAFFLPMYSLFSFWKRCDSSYTGVQNKTFPYVVHSKMTQCSDQLILLLSTREDVDSVMSHQSMLIGSMKRRRFGG
jgi:hypothetical protein